MSSFLVALQTDILIVSGTAINQGKFRYDFDDIILLTAPTELIIDQLIRRPEGEYGSSAADRARLSERIETVEPLLRNAANHEIDTSAPMADVVETMIAILVGAPR